ncbi:MAG: glycosyltransferase family 2 protein [Acidiphilium sp.]|nr:glycosyltransferase family 2 protein [Acidiphilium sp.]MDD4935559.1 glycosyltransferase family 2 protein [Acidiphilium sp.]
MKPLAVLCKFYNEPAYLPLWGHHYGRQAGIENCYLLDHGSDDGSQGAVGGANVVRLLRSPQNDYRHRDLIVLFTSELLKRYHYVLHVDMDEFVVADPARYPSLAAYAAQNRHPVVSMFGFELQHVVGREPNLSPDEAVLSQRRHVWFNSAMCKPALTNGPLDWSPGFHCMSSDTVFDDLYLFHLCHVDRDIGLRRLQRSRSQPWSHPDQASHQRVSDETWLATLAGYGAVARLSTHEADPASAVMRDCLDAVVASRKGREHECYRIDLNIHSQNLWLVPDRFASIF